MAKRTTTMEAPEEAPQAQTARRQVVDMTGNVVRAAALRCTPNGTAFAMSGPRSAATTGRRAGSGRGLGHLAEIVAAHVKQGDRLGVRGRVAERQWTGRDGTQVLGGLISEHGRTV